MRKFPIDTQVVLKLPNQPGQLAKVAQAVGDQGALVGEIDILHYGEGTTHRDVTIETADEAHTARVLEALRALPGVEVISQRDCTFERHQGGKIEMRSRVELKQLKDLRYIYTPGVARVVRAIKDDPERVWELTSLRRTVGIFTNGTRVLGLGDVGPLASLPVMEGKAVLYEKFAGLSAVPILVESRDPAVFVSTVLRIAGSFGAIHLEDIQTPHCYEIEEALKARLGKPVFHDDQHGTATAVLAAVISACRQSGVELRGKRLGQVGAGASGRAIARLAMIYGMSEVWVSEPNPVPLRAVVDAGARSASLEDLMKSCDIVVASTGKPGLIAPEAVREGQVIFALSNPEPEITPEQARAAGARFAADGRSVNNALAYPGIMRGALQAGARTITTDMYVAAALAIADSAPPGELVPSPLDPAVHAAVTEAVRAKAVEQGLGGTLRYAVAT
jgi:malate dehydrogenase (oxaloacetate-decarboxylating)